MSNAAELRERLTGPIPSIRPPFTADGELDLVGVDRYVEACLAVEPTAVMITYGDSHLHVLTDVEIQELTRRVVDGVAGRAMVIAGDGSWWTRRAVEFAHWSKDNGVDILMAYPPDWAASCSVDSTVAHLGALSEAGLPLMLLTAWFRSRGGADALTVIDRVRAEVPAVVAVKDDVGADLGRRVALAVGEEWALVAGGSKQLFTQLSPYGCRAWLSILAVYRPDLARQYHDWIRAGDLAAAAQFVRTVDAPMFDLLVGFTGSFDAAFHGWLELVGIAGRWRRPPHHSQTDDELARLATGLAELGLLEGTGR